MFTVLTETFGDRYSVDQLFLFDFFDGPLKVFLIILSPIISQLLSVNLFKTGLQNFLTIFQMVKIPQREPIDFCNIVLKYLRLYLKQPKN